MSHKQIDSRTIVSDSFAPFGEFQSLPDRPDESAEERDRKKAADRITGTDLRRMLGDWTPDQLDAAIAGRNFPKPIAYREGGWMRPQREPIYSFKQVAAWLDREREFQATLPKELKR